jgi:hypothetical protein
MTKKTPETLIALCDTIANGTLSYAAACRAVGISTRSFWNYIKASQGGDETYVIEYLGEQIQFAKAVNAARRMALHEIRARFEQRCLMGHDEIQTYMGEITWQKDRRCVGIDDPDIREMLGYPRDGLLRNEAGEVVPNVVHHQPPVAAVLRVIEAAFPVEYRPGTNSTVAISGGAVVGVQMMQPSSKPPVIPPAPPLPQLEVLDDSDAMQIPETDDDAPEEMADEEPAEDVQPVPQSRVQSDERMIAELPPANYQPPPPAAPLAARRPLSPLERDLIFRARGTPEERAAPITAQPKLDRSRTS